MAINSGLNIVIKLISLMDASKNAIAVRVPTVEDLFYLTDNKAKVESTLQLSDDMNIVADIDIHRIMFVFDWFITNIMDPNFACTDFTRAVYVADKWARAVANADKISTLSVTTTTPASSTIDFSADVLLTDAKRQATPPTPRTTGTLNSHKLRKSPFAAASRNSSNARQLHITDLVLASSKPLDVIEFYRKIFEATKPAEIDFIHVAQFYPECTLYPMIVALK
jgi:hypothetical protein